MSMNSKHSKKNQIFINEIANQCNKSHQTFQWLYNLIHCLINYEWFSWCNSNSEYSFICIYIKSFNQSQAHSYNFQFVQQLKSIHLTNFIIFQFWNVYSFEIFTDFLPEFEMLFIQFTHFKFGHRSKNLIFFKKIQLTLRHITNVSVILSLSIRLFVHYCWSCLLYANNIAKQWNEKFISIKPK